MATYQFDTYSVTYYSGYKAASRDYGPKEITIALRSQGKIVAYLYFYPDISTSLPNDYEVTSSGYGVAHFRSNEFPRIMDILRNEKPLSVDFRTNSKIPSNVSGTTWALGELRTSAETVGEDDI